MTNLGVRRGRALAVLATLMVVAAAPVLAQDTIPAATFDAGLLVRDGEGLLPLNDWVPLFQFTMSYGLDSPAPRYLRTLDFTVRSDPRPQDDVGYWIGNGGPIEEDLLEFGIFIEGNVPDERGELDRPDRLILTFDSYGEPFGTVSGGRGNLRYVLDFGEIDGRLMTAAPEDGNAFILAVRTSAVWHSGQTLGVAVNDADMLHLFDGAPVGDDNYPFDDGPVTEDVAYSASFTAWDHTGNGSSGVQVWDEQQNNWIWPVRWYEPLSEHFRPRWDLPGTMFEFVTGEILNIRQLFSVETWVPVVGINMHATSQIHYADPLRPTPYEETTAPAPAALREVNMVFTDIGGDPASFAGSGGFDPRTQLDRVTAFVHQLQGNAQFANGRDFSFNGVWVFHDTNNNGIFDPPVPDGSPANGVTFTDFPMYPDFLYFDTVNMVDPSLGWWQHIGNPPGGGDPWWRIKLRFDNGRRRNSGDEPTGYLEPVPDSLDDPFFSQYTSDYFVVFRADSGFQDVSGLPGDGTGYLPGADFRAFVEPRWFDPVQGHWQGGIFSDAMIPSHPGFIQNATVIDAWQDDSRWRVDEPWWHQRTVNQDATKPQRGGIEVHDFAMLYNSNSDFAVERQLDYAYDFEDWMDPFGFRRSHFFYNDYVDVMVWGEWIWGTLNGVPFFADDWRAFQFPFETAPFRNPVFDGPIAGPRSPLYAFPPTQPTLPSYATWPASLPPGRYPSIFDWAPEHRRARYLKQYITIESESVPLLGINLAAADDVNVNRVNARYLNELYVAFYGPDFTPDKLLEVDSRGISADSGVHLREDNGDGTYRGLFSPDAPLPVRDLEWAEAPELVDLDGDGVADDLNGDGVVNALDRAWVLRFVPVTPWLVPSTDAATTSPEGGGGGGGDIGGGGGGGDEAARAKPTVASFAALQGRGAKSAQGSAEKLAPVSGNAGIDLWVTIRTSDQLKRFEWIKAVIPATLPERPANQREAGIRTTPTARFSPGALMKRNPDEGPVQDYYEHDELPASVPVKIASLIDTNQTIGPSSEAPALGIDISTNRGAEGTLAQGTSGIGSVGGFAVASAQWTPNAFAGAFLLDRTYRAFEIVSNTQNELVLFNRPVSAVEALTMPATGPWRILKDPTFLEQIIVELYDEGNNGTFNILQDLLPLDIDQTVSGVAIYRDNDAHPNNRNGVFDPDIDIPVMLDGTPHFIGQTGQAPNQVRFVFSSPGTDDVPVPRQNQALLRQWVPDTWGDPENESDPDLGDDFFVVVRTSDRIGVGDNFRVAIVTFGPDTPTQPDPDTFARDNVPQIRRDDQALFVEYPWGSRALGFITLYQNPPDNSGFNWIRHTTSVAARSNVLTGAAGDSTDPGTISLTAISPSAVPTTIAAGGTTLTLTGTGFGTSPTVTAGTVNLTVISATDTRITATIPGGSTFDPGSVRVTVRNSATGRQASANNLLQAIEGEVPPGPVITSISPSSGSSANFPVTITGSNFNDPQVFFGGTNMPVASSTPNSIRVNFPASGLALTGPLDVEVRSTYTVSGNQKLTLSTTRANGFTYVNAPGGAVRACFIATAAYGTPFEGRLDSFRGFRDGVLLKTSAGTALVDFYYTVSPSVADAVAARPWLATTVRLALTPVAWALEVPARVGVALSGLALLLAAGRRRRHAGAR